MAISPYGHNDKGSPEEWAAYHRRVKEEENMNTQKPDAEKVELLRRKAITIEELLKGFLPDQFVGRDAEWRKVETLRELSGDVQMLCFYLSTSTAERDKYRDACEKLIEHYGDEQMWGVSDESAVVSDWYTSDGNGYDFARQVEAEIKGELK